MKKIQMTTPLVEMDGDEMTRILWKMIKDELLLPFIDLNTEYYDLGLNYRTVQKGDFNNACTDVGDLSHFVPVVNFTFKGFEGKLHGADFKITDPEKAYILPAKLLALTVYKLLKNGGQEAKKITKSYTPVFNKESYIQYVKNTIE